MYYSIKEFDQVIEQLMFSEYIIALLYLIASLILFALGKICFGIFNRSTNASFELLLKDNLAFSFSYVGYYIAIIMIVGGVLTGESKGISNDLINIFLFGILGIVLLNVSERITDKIVLYKFKLRKEILEDMNLGTGVIGAAVYLATGLVLMASISGDEGSVLIALFFWLIGQFLLVVATFVYNLITPYDIHEELERDNVAVGVGFSGAIIAIGNIIYFGVSSEYVDVLTNTKIILVYSVLGLVMLPVMRFIVDRVMLPNHKLTDEIANQEESNVGAALIEAFAYIGGSVLITWCLV